MKEITQKIYDELFVRYPALTEVKTNILSAFELIKESLAQSGTVFCCGNGGSASDSEHIVGELLKSFKKHRKVDEKTAEGLKTFGAEGEFVLNNLEGSLPAVSLVSQTGVLTAFANDKAWETAFAQQLYGLGRKGDCLISLSTSGNSKNCVYASMAARAKGIKTIAFTGNGGGKLKEVCDVTINVPETATYKVQEAHLPIYHCICAMLEEEFFD